MGSVRGLLLLRLETEDLAEVLVAFRCRKLQASDGYDQANGQRS